MKLALNVDTFAKTDSFDNICIMANRFGIKHLELWASPLECTAGAFHPFAFKGKDLQKTKQTLKKYHLDVCSIGFGCGIDRFFANDPALYSQEFVRAVEVASELSAGIVNHYSDQLHPVNADVHYFEPFWEAALKRAEELGVVLTLENEALDDFTNTPEKMLNIICYFDSDSFKTNYDATNYYQASCEPFPYAYEVLKEHIAYVHIKNGIKPDKRYCKDPDWFGGKMTRTVDEQPIYYVSASEGAVNNDGLLLRLAADGYDGFCALEPHTTRERAIACIEKEVQYLMGKSMFQA